MLTLPRPTWLDRPPTVLTPAKWLGDGLRMLSCSFWTDGTVAYLKKGKTVVEPSENCPCCCTTHGGCAYPTGATADWSYIASATFTWGTTAADCYGRPAYSATYDYNATVTGTGLQHRIGMDTDAIFAVLEAAADPADAANWLFGSGPGGWTRPVGEYCGSFLGLFDVNESLVYSGAGIDDSASRVESGVPGVVTRWGGADVEGYVTAHARLTLYKKIPPIDPLAEGLARAEPYYGIAFGFSPSSWAPAVQPFFGYAPIGGILSAETVRNATGSGACNAITVTADQSLVRDPTAYTCSDWPYEEYSRVYGGSGTLAASLIIHDEGEVCGPSAPDPENPGNPGNPGIPNPDPNPDPDPGPDPDPPLVVRQVWYQWHECSPTGDWVPTGDWYPMHEDSQHRANRNPTRNGRCWVLMGEPLERLEPPPPAWDPEAANEGPAGQDQPDAPASIWLGEPLPDGPSNDLPVSGDPDYDQYEACRQVWLDRFGPPVPTNICTPSQCLAMTGCPGETGGGVPKPKSHECGPCVADCVGTADPSIACQFHEGLTATFTYREFSAEYGSADCVGTPFETHLSVVPPTTLTYDADSKKFRGELTLSGYNDTNPPDDQPPDPDTATPTYQRTGWVTASPSGRDPTHWLISVSSAIGHFSAGLQANGDCGGAWVVGGDPPGYCGEAPYAYSWRTEWTWVFVVDPNTCEPDDGGGA